MARAHDALLIALVIAVSGCGGGGTAEAEQAGADKPRVMEAVAAARAPARDGAAGAAQASPDADAAAMQTRQAGASDLSATSESSETLDEAALTREMVQVMREMQALGKDPNANAERRAQLQKQLQDIGTRMNLARLKKRSNRPGELKLPPEWQQTHRVEKNGPEADLLVQVGDIDNLGFGWPDGFDPFSGESTPKHNYPWQPEADDPAGTDRIMVISGFDRKSQAAREGYSRDTARPDNRPQALAIEFDAKAVPIRSAVLQLFVDDFQAPKMGNRFSVKLDDRDAPDIAATINQLNQTGPIGKLLTVQLLPEYLPLLADGRLSVFVDDASTNVGDGFAFDFARLLINPKGWKYTGTIRGVARETGTGKALEGVLVSAGNVRQGVTGKDGRFELLEVPAGLVVTTGSHPDYVADSERSDLLAGKTVEIELELQRNRGTSAQLAQQLKEEGKVDLYGIYFDTDKATLKSESEEVLQQVRAMLEATPGLRVVIAGHTDSQASDAYNLDLSKRRAAAVVAWLTAHGIGQGRLSSQGHGESRPIADNATTQGRALNRRVEIRDASR